MTMTENFEVQPTDQTDAPEADAETVADDAVNADAAAENAVTDEAVDADTSLDGEQTQATATVESAVSSEAVPSQPADEPDVQAEVPADGDVSSHTVAEEAFDSDTDEEDEDEDDDDDEESSLLFLSGDWYVVHTYAGYENKVKANLASRIQSMNMEDKIYDVVVPTEEVMELKSGKMQAVQKKVFPGYILVRMELDDDSWYVVRNTPGVTGFVGSGAKPTPLDSLEVSRILQPKTEDRPKPKLEYEIGEVVSVVGGAFSGYSGPVNAIDPDKQRVTVLLDLFGRETPVELTFEQVTKL
jgi:transcription termination/antitermination protein NusG